MKILTKILLLILILNQGCGSDRKETNKFLSSTDTLVIRTEKHKNRGLFLSSSFPLEFNDTVGNITNSLVFPNTISDIKHLRLPTDFSPDNENYVDIITGMRGTERAFIVDENNNKNFCDDSIRIWQKLKWDSSEGLIKCKYLISNGKEIVADSSWVQLREVENILWFGRKEHLTADIKINKEQYKIGITDLFSGNFTYGIHSWIALLSDNKTSKDTLLEKDILSIGEALALGTNYYRFEKISNNGDYVTLIKEKNFDKEVGLQIGMIAPEFTCKTVAGDTVRSSVLHDRIMVIANSCGCGGDVLSTEAYYEMEKEYANSIHILRLDSKIEKDAKGLQIDMEEKINRDIYDKYRKTYCSRTCYVIDKNNRIIDRFPSSDWKLFIPKHLIP